MPIKGVKMHMIDVLISAVESAGFRINGPTDIRACENNEPIWVCEARALIAELAQELAEQHIKEMNP
jgi:hypothetical protein